jgi:hypothetical protein
MGVFLDDKQEDDKFLPDLLEAFTNYWNSLPYSKEISIAGVSTAADKISGYAEEVYSTYLEAPSYYQRIAAFLVFITACPCLSVREQGRLIRKERRQHFIARVNLLLLPALFTSLARHSSDVPPWPGFPPGHIVRQLVAWFELIDVSDLVEIGINSHSIKGLAKDIAALSLILQLWVEFNQNPGHHDVATLLTDSGIIIS